MKDKTARGFLWGALNNGAMQVLNALFGIVLAHQLNQADYGLVGMLTIFTLIANSLQDSGFVTALTNKRNATHLDYNSVFWFNTAVSLTLYLLFFLCAPLIARFFNEPLLTPLSRYYFLGFFIASFSIVPRAILFRQIKQKELTIMGLTAMVVSGIVGITMAFMGLAYWGLATQTIVFNLTITFMSWMLSHWRPTWQFSTTPIKEMFSFSSKMLITNIFIGVNNNIFSVVLGKLYDKHTVGTYNQANKWNTMGSSLITGMVQGVAQPAFVAVGDDMSRLRRIFSKMLRFTAFVSFPVMFGLAMVAPEFIVVLIGQKWLSSAHLMQLLCIGGAFLPIATLYYNLIISRGKSNVYMWNVIAQGCIILGSILLISTFDISSLDFSLFTQHSSLFTLHFSLNRITCMVIAYVAIIILWTAIWHRFLHHEISYPFRSALKDMLPFMLLAAATMLITYCATLWMAPDEGGMGRLLLLLLTRILLAAILYLGILWLTRAKILHECWGYLRKK